MKFIKKEYLKTLKKMENGIIYREFSNHECFYVGDYTEAIEKVEDYPITPEEIIKVYNSKKREHLE